MSSADGWDLTVPEDAAELLAELRRHGVRPGQRLHVVRASDDQSQQSSEETEGPVTRTLDFIGSVHGGPADLSTRTDDYLRRGFGRECSSSTPTGSSPPPGPQTPTTRARRGCSRPSSNRGWSHLPWSLKSVTCSANGVVRTPRSGSCATSGRAACA